MNPGIGLEELSCPVLFLRLLPDLRRLGEVGRFFAAISFGRKSSWLALAKISG